MIDSFKTINKKILQSKNYVLLTNFNLKKEFFELQTITNILIISTIIFNTFGQQASYAKDMKIFNILICNIKKNLG